MSLSVDIARELNSLPVSPEIRRQIEDLWPDVEARLAEEARRQAKDAGAVDTNFLLSALAGILMGWPREPDQSRLPVTIALANLLAGAVTQAPRAHAPARRPTHPYNQEAYIALLDSFDDGDQEEQRRTLEYLRTAIDRDRPGQRSIFGDGINPTPAMDEIA